MTVQQINVPATARALSALPRADYADAFVVRLGSTQERTALQWARAILEGAPVRTRGALVSGWSTIGLKLGALWSDAFVLGWSVRRSTDDFVLLGADSRIGMPGELLFVRRLRTVLFSTFVQQDTPVARAVWARVEPVHVPTVRRLLEDAHRRLSH